MTTEPNDRTVPGPRLGKLIEERRHQLGLSKSSAARLAGINRGTWHDIETGTRMNMLPDTLNQIESVLDWEPGTIYRMLNNPGDRDVVISQPDGTVTIVEGRMSRIESSPVSSTRHRIIALIAAMNDQDLERLLSALQHDLPGVATRTEMDETRVELAQLRRMIEQLSQQRPPQLDGHPDGDGRQLINS